MIFSESCTTLCARVPDSLSRAERSVKRPNARAVRRSIYLERDCADQVATQAQRDGYRNPSAFIRAAIQHKLTHGDSAMDEAERRITASLDRVARELRSIRLRQQAEFAFVDALVKMLLTHVAEVPRESHDQAVARGKVRYERFLKSVGMGLTGESEMAMTELMRRVEGE